MSKSFLTPINLNKNELQNATIQNLATAPSSPVEGQVYFDTVDNTMYVYADGSWLDMGVQGGAGATDISISRTGTTVTVNSNTGDDGEIDAADGTDAGVMTSDMYTKLDGIEEGAEANTVDSVNTKTGIVVLTQDDVGDGTTYKRYSSTEKSKLAGIEASADVTDATNVDAAGAVMNSDTTTASMSFVLDEDDMTSNSATKVPTQQSTKTYVDGKITDLVGSAPSALDTLGEISDALNDDADLAGTLTASIATKLAKSSNLSDVADAATAFVNIKQSATTSASGVAELATTAETEAKSDTGRVVTPSGLTNFPIKKSFTIGDGTSTSITCTHNLGTKDVVVQVRQASDDAVVECDITQTSTTVTTLGFSVAPATNALKVVIIG